MERENTRGMPGEKDCGEMNSARQRGKCPQGNLTIFELRIPLNGGETGEKGEDLLASLVIASFTRQFPLCRPLTPPVKGLLNPSASSQQNDIRKDMKQESSQSLTFEESGCFYIYDIWQGAFCKAGGSLQSIFAKKLRISAKSKELRRKSACLNRTARANKPIS